MEYSVMGDLKRYLDTFPSRRMDVPSVAAIARQLLDVLEYLAGQGLMHRDLKPENIMVNQGPVVQLTDFGLSTESWRGKDYCGTREYLAPEVFHVASPLHTEYDERVDVWSLGVVILELLGDLPQWPRNQEQYYRRIRDKLSSKTLPFYTLVRHMLAENPTERATASECLTKLWPTDLRGRIDDSGFSKRPKTSMMAQERITRLPKPTPAWVPDFSAFCRPTKPLSWQVCSGPSPKERRLNQQHFSKYCKDPWGSPTEIELIR